MLIHLSWQEHDQAVREMLERLPHKEYDLIIGVARSGLVAAVHAAHILGIRAFGVMDIRRTDSDEPNAPKEAPKVGWLALSEDLAGKNVLLVDDIVGAGETMAAARQALQAQGAVVTTAAVVVNLDNYKGDALESLVDAYGLLVRGWVVFPWCA